MHYKTEFTIGNDKISFGSFPYFIADIGANHDGSLSRAIDLVGLAKESGAHCAKFQHFKAKDIVSDFGFSRLDRSRLSHQASWAKSVAQIYDEYHLRREWNEALVQACKDNQIEFMTTPYDFEAMDDILHDVNAIKVGSGDITYHQLLGFLSSLGRPILLATGASSLTEVKSAMAVVSNHTDKICLMQCNTNYTGDHENFKYVNLKVLQTFAQLYPNLPLGLSDHTPGHSAVLGAISLGATIIEKHFTDDVTRVGPDHHFALDPSAWKEMVDRSFELHVALGDGEKRIEKNEEETVIVQRRAIRLKQDIKMGHKISLEDIEFLRPCPVGALQPFEADLILGRQVSRAMSQGEELKMSDFY